MLVDPSSNRGRLDEDDAVCLPVVEEWSLTIGFTVRRSMGILCIRANSAMDSLRTDCPAEYSTIGSIGAAGTGTTPAFAGARVLRSATPNSACCLMAMELRDCPAGSSPSTASVSMESTVATRGDETGDETATGAVAVVETGTAVLIREAKKCK